MFVRKVKRKAINVCDKQHDNKAVDITLGVKAMARSKNERQF